MDTIIVHPKDKEQATALKSIMKALKIDFKTDKSIEKPYSAAFMEKMDRADADIKAGRTTMIDPAGIWNLE